MPTIKIPSVISKVVIDSTVGGWYIPSLVASGLAREADIYSLLLELYTIDPYLSIFVM